MKILVAQIIGYGSYGKGLMLEQLQAVISENPNAEIFYLTCSNSFNICYFNPLSNPEICYLCKEGKKNSLKLIEGKFRHITIDDLITLRDIEISENFMKNTEKIDFDLKYENYRVGESALSSYISTTRDRDLENVKNSFTDKLVKNGISLYSGLKRFCEEQSFDIVYNFNGRHIYNRAVMDMALCLNIPLYNVEIPRVGATIELFKNVLPHNIDAKQNFFAEAWNNSKLSESERENIASEYFINKRSGTKKYARSFTDNQVKNNLPDSIDYTKSTVVLYTSSDDEFAAVGKEFKNPYFKDQNEGIYYVAKLFNEQFSDQNLIIRVHPNFAGVKYDYARRLNDLKGKYTNVFLIEAESKIDSYALLDIADKVITFGSSITTEATFWQKPVIMLGISFFSGMNIAYEPNKIEELEHLLKIKLSPKPKLGSLKFGHYLIKGGTKAKYYNRDFKGIYFKGKKLYFYSKKQLIIAKLIRYFYKTIGVRLFVK
jgi:hypothetical protein